MKIIKILLFTCVVAVAKNHCKAADDGRPLDHYCPITLQVMMDPVVAADGISYEKYAIQEWLRNRNSSPVTRKIFNNTNIVENLALKRLIDDWKPGQQFKACEFETLDALTISQRVRHEFDQNADLFNVAKGKHIVAFLGNTGTGKSTLVNLLSGKQIMSADGQDYVLVDPGDLTATAIGTEGISVTLYPKFVDVGDFRYFDLPGFNDADGSFRNLVNSAFIRKIFMDAESVRLVIVVGQDQFTADRGVLVNQMFNSIGQLFVADQHADLIDESIFVATKVTFDFDGDRFIDFLLKKTNAGDKQILNNQLKLWGGKNRLHRMFHPIASTNGKIENLKKEINCSIRDTKQAKVLGVNVSALFPPNTRDHLKRLFSNIMEGVLKCKFAQSLTTLSQYDAAIALCSCYEDFWGAFDRDVCQDELISLLKEFCISSYNEAFAKLINNAEGLRCHYIEDLIARRQERLKDIEAVKRRRLELQENFEDI